MSLNKVARVFLKFTDSLTVIFLNPVLCLAKLKNPRSLKYKQFSLTILYSVASLVSMYFSFSDIKRAEINVGNSLQFFETSIPILINFYIGLDLIQQKKLVLALQLRGSSDEESNMKLRIKLVVRLLIVISARILKFWFEPHSLLTYSGATIIPELTMSINDFIFVFYVEAMTLRIEKFNSHLKSSEMRLENLKIFESEIEELSKDFRIIEEFFSSRLILTVFYNFMLLIISLYWIFITITFGYLQGTKFITFVYIVQPALCIFSIFLVSEKCQKTVKC